VLYRALILTSLRQHQCKVLTPIGTPTSKCFILAGLKACTIVTNVTQAWQHHDIITGDKLCYDDVLDHGSIQFSLRT